MKYVRMTALVKSMLAAAVLVSQLVVSAHAGGGSEVNKGDNGVAIKGYDPVSYFTDGAPAKGSAEHSVDWKGATWQFASAANRDAFAADPEKFAPAYGGYCAVGTRMGLKIDIQPDQFKIVDNTLYINSSTNAHNLWLQDVPGNIATANQNWPDIKFKTAAELKAAQ
ncbi:MAG: YHS domain-containing (seleno)protein [Pseudomonadota bacterium]